uniref:Plethodontid modulating factor n=1 Tax=Panagrellus redivivus TaxID=6233 RepID=A0A7E4VWF7_PANRE
MANYLLATVTMAVIIASTSAVLCRTGVDSVEGPLVDCSNHQCLNTTSPEATVYSCDYSRICDMIQLHNECIQEQDKVICCCLEGDGCNAGFENGGAKTAYEYARLRKLDSHIQPLY